LVFTGAGGVLIAPACSIVRSLRKSALEAQPAIANITAHIARRHVQVIWKASAHLHPDMQSDSVRRIAQILPGGQTRMLETGA
jgi:hypothetical protein